MNHTTRVRLAGLLLPLSVGVVGAIGYAVNNNNDGGPAKAKTAGSDTGSNNGTVVASPSAGPAAGGGSGGGGGSAGGNGNGGGPSGSFTIAGDVTGLVPGVSKTLPVTISNPNPWPIQVLTIDTGVGAPDHSPCPASVLTVARYTYSNGGAVIQAPARGTTTLNLSVSLADSLTVDQTGCPTATFPLTFSGTAVKVAGR